MSRLVIPRRRIRRPSEADVAYGDLCVADAPEGIARRRFLQGALAAGGAAGFLPSWLDQVAAAAAPLAASDRVLVVVTLNGGNDHLNTLVPADDGHYHARRGALALGAAGAHAVGEGLYLHPNLARLKARFDAGQVAMVRGVGEASDDHSHFTSMATWMAGIQGLPNPTGWLGRYLDGAGRDGLGAVNVDWGGVPLLLRGHASTATALPPNGNLFGADRSEGWERYPIEAISAIGAGNVDIGPFGNIVADNWSSAVDTAAAMNPAFGSGLPEDGFVRELALAARVVNLNLGTQIVSVTLGGFDHHDDQRPDHDDLMAELDAGIDAFFGGLSAEFANRTAMLVYSEFGRRVGANDSGGTDHGTAGLMMLVGPRVNGGLHGVQPSLANLDSRGDMHHHLDFREVYASVLAQWLDADDREILGTTYGQLDLFARSGPGGFYDVPASAYFAPAVAWLAETGITSGTRPGEFSPGDVVTRGQMVTFLWRYRGRPGGSPASSFSDVPRGAYYAAAVDWAAANGITTGTGGGRFSPDDPVTRAQMATFLWRLEGMPGGAPPAGFSDVPRGHYFSEAVDWLLHRGITMGTGPGRFSPHESVDRGQMATFLWRLAGSPV